MVYACNLYYPYPYRPLSYCKPSRIFESQVNNEAGDLETSTVAPRAFIPSLCRIIFNLSTTPRNRNRQGRRADAAVPPTTPTDAATCVDPYDA